MKDIQAGVLNVKYFDVGQAEGPVSGALAKEHAGSVAAFQPSRQIRKPRMCAVNL